MGWQPVHGDLLPGSSIKPAPRCGFGTDRFTFLLRLLWFSRHGHRFPGLGTCPHPGGYRDVPAAISSRDVVACWAEVEDVK